MRALVANGQGRGLNCGEQSQGNNSQQEKAGKFGWIRFSNASDNIERHERLSQI
jgi:hypothetical protein